MANIINQRIAFGLPREVDLSEEVIVITGGASGLGMLVAEVYGMRGASVAVLDVNDMEHQEARGITFYRCDVSDKDQVAKAAAQIEKDVSLPSINHASCSTILTTTLSSAPQPSSSTTPPSSSANLSLKLPSPTSKTA
jgi:NAD(P)-dependent dehydrogenase (short-subunit alcohol dehydrogenase family)